MHRVKRSPLLIAAAVGLAWGMAGYAVLWGHTSIVVHRSFVVSAVGTVLLAPVRLVLWGIHVVERAAGGPFDFSGNNWWIGLVSAAVGAGIAALVTLGLRGVARAARGSGGKRVPEAPEGL